jgi:peptidoglycan/xylan/chitin deacetylase (PgdA/CDA1 family)
MAGGVSRLLSGLGLDRVVDRISRSAGGCVLCYHHISPSALETQLRELSRRYAICSLGDLITRLEADKPTSGSVAVTFDDGFAREIEGGSALAIRYGWPMTFYLPTGFLTSRQPYWFEAIGPWLLAARSGEYRLGDLRFRLDGERSRWRVRQLLVRHLFYRSAAEIDELTMELDAILFGDQGCPTNLEIPDPISWERVRELSRHEQITFGAHSVSHPFFCNLSPERIRGEMEESRRRVEEATGRQVDHFCYPYGDLRAIGPQAPDIAGKLFRSSATVVRGRCSQGVDRSLLPRITLFEHYTTSMVSWKVVTTR